MYSSKNIHSYFEKKSKDLPFDPNQSYRYVFSEDHNGDHIIELYDKDTDGLILKADYSIIGMYNLYSSVWYWGYSLSFANHSATDDSKKVLDVAEDIKKHYKKYDDGETDEIHYLASNSHFYCSLKNIPKVVELGLYVMKGEWFIEIRYDSKDNVVVGKSDKETPVKKVEYYCINKVIYRGSGSSG